MLAEEDEVECLSLMFCLIALGTGSLTEPQVTF